MYDVIKLPRSRSDRGVFSFRYLALENGLNYEKMMCYVFRIVLFNPKLTTLLFEQFPRRRNVFFLFSNFHFQGDRDDMTNYRPISVLYTVARVFERLLYNQLHDYLIVNSWGSDHFILHFLH